MAIRLVQNTCTHNKKKTINNYLTNVPSKKRGHLATNFDSILFIVGKDINNIFQLQGLLEHNGFNNKLATIKQMLNMYLKKN
jgi:hypothetical protein